MKTELEILKENGFVPVSDLSYCTIEETEFYIGYKGNTAAVVVLIQWEDKYLLEKKDLREMAATAKIKGIDHVTLYTNYGCEIMSKYESSNTVGFNLILKLQLSEF